MADITQRLPPELLIEILSHASVLDVLRFKQVRRKPLQDLCTAGFVERSRHLQVNRIFYNAILASPLIQHKLDLFAAGFEYNAAAGIDLAESQKAFLQHISSLDSLRPIEERVVGEVQMDGDYHSKTSGGVHAVFTDSVRLFSLGSASRGIPYKEWNIPSPIDHPMACCICSHANLIVFVKEQADPCVP